MQAIEFSDVLNAPGSLKKKLGMPGAQGNDLVAEELRLLLKLKRDHSLRGRTLAQRCGKTWLLS